MPLRRKNRPRNYQKRSREVKRRLLFEWLDERAVLASLLDTREAVAASLSQIDHVVVVTHGFSFGEEENGNYMSKLAEAIAVDDGGLLIRRIVPGLLQAENFEWRSLPGRDAASDSLKTVVLQFDWETESRMLSAGWAEAAGDALFSILVGLDLARLGGGSKSFHFIGHSFGTVVNSEAIERLAAVNISVDQMTTLDPHDFAEQGVPLDQYQEMWKNGSPSDSSTQQGYGVTVWNNVAFADNYYQTRSDAKLPLKYKAACTIAGGFGGYATGIGLLPGAVMGSAVCNELGNSVIPSGRPIPGAYNYPVGSAILDNPSGFDVETFHDHGFVWEGYYYRSIMDSSFSHAGGWEWSRSSTTGGTPVRPGTVDGQGQETIGAFYHNAQGHQWSSTALVSGSYGTEERSNPPSESQRAVYNSYRASPDWNPNTIYNGDFSFGNPGFSADPREAVFQDARWIAPGWSQQGGGIADVNEQGRYARIVNRTDTDRQLTHNYMVIPQGATSLEFDVQKVLNRATGLGPTFEQTENHLFIMATPATGPTVALGKIRVSDIGTTFATKSVSIPVAIRGQAVLLSFQLSGEAQTMPLINWTGEKPDELRLDDIRYGVQPAPVSQPDLTVGTTTADASSVQVGQPLQVQALIGNIGAAASRATAVQFYLSKDIVLGANDISLGTVPLVALTNGQTAQVSLTANIPVATLADSYLVLAQVDPANIESNELSESNNTFISNSRVTVFTSQATAHPDFVLSALQVPQYGIPGQSIAVQTLVNNLGGEYGGAITVTYQLEQADGTLIALAGQPISRTEMGGWIQTIAMPSGLANGHYLLRATVNADRSITESNIENNSRSASIYIRSLEVPQAPTIGFHYPIGRSNSGTEILVPFLGSLDADHTQHLGVDFRGGANVPVFAAADGEVVFSQKVEGRGQVIIIEHNTRAWGWDKDVYSLYANVTTKITVNTPVKRGEQIATVGSRLNFEIRSGGDADSVVGSEYGNGRVQQTESNSYKLKTYPHDIVWHDPLLVINPNLPGGTPKPDLVPYLANAGLNAKSGEVIPVYFEVGNRGSAGAISVPLKIFLSNDPNITLRDRELLAIANVGSLNPGDVVKRSVQVPLPSDLVVGKTYWIGVSVDPDKVILEESDSNNEQADSNAIAIIPVVVTQPDLQGKTLSVTSPQGPFRWGQQLNVDYSLSNIGNQAAGTSVTKFYLANHPTNPTFELELSPSKNVGAISPAQQANGNVRLSLPVVPPSDLESVAQIYLRMKVDANNSVNEVSNDNNFGQGRGIDWVELPLATPPGPIDLRGSSIRLEPVQTTLNWGQSYRVQYSFTNQGGTRTTPFRVAIHLGAGSAVSKADLQIGSDDLGLIAPGQTVTRFVWVNLPKTPPAGAAHGPFTVGTFLDADNALAEIDRADNQQLGAGIDRLHVSIVPGSYKPEPVIGGIVAAPNDLLRGERVFLTASNVLDDNNVVNEVVFRLDTNENGFLESTDLYLGHGSKSGLIFTLDVKTDTRWKTGVNTILAQAMDNHGLKSDVLSTTVTLRGVPQGPFADDAYENNDTLESAAYLGGAGNYSLPNLALAQGDPDLFAFDVLGQNATITARIEFLQDVQQVGQPRGDLYLELVDATGRGLGFSDVSQAGNTFEQIQLTRGQGRYFVRVASQNILGLGQPDFNPSYSLTLTVTPPANYPVAGDLLISPDVITVGATTTMSLATVQLFGGTTVEGVHFYIDWSGDGQIQFDPEYVGSDWGLPDGANWQVNVPLNGAPGKYKAIVIVEDSLGRTSLASTAELTVVPNEPPGISAISGPATIVQGMTGTWMATGLFDSDAGIARVRSYLDSNLNGAFDPDDLPLGDGVINNQDAVFTRNTRDWAVGPTTIFFEPIDLLGLTGEPLAWPVTVNASTNLIPVIGSFSLPGSLERGSPLQLELAEVTDPNNDPLQAEFWIDLDRDGALSPSDRLLASGSIANGGLAAVASTAPFTNGMWSIFAVVKDDGLPAFITSLTAEVLIVDRQGARVLTQAPATSVAGSLDSIEFTFDEPIEATSFTVADILSLTGPSGSITPTAVQPVDANSTTFRVSFPRQTTPGAYALQLGTAVADLGGNFLDQNANGVNGELGDTFTANVAITATDVELHWSNAWGGTQDDRVNDLVVTSTGEIITVGRFFGTVDFDPGLGVTTATSSGFDIFIARYSSTGSLLWVKTVGGSSSDIAYSVDLDSSGNIYLTGEFRGTVDFDPGAGTVNLTASGSGSPDLFVLSLNSTGNYRWAQRVGGTWLDTGYALKVSGSAVYIAGEFSRTVDFNPGAGVNNLTAAGAVDGTDGFLLKLSTVSGAYVWAKAMGSSADDRVEDLAIDGAGNVYIVGWYNATSNFDPGGTGTSRTTNGGNDAFVSKYDASGTFQWVQTWGGGSTDQALAIAIDSSSNLFVTGSFALTADLNPGATTNSFTSSGGLDAFLLKLNSAGQYGWARQVGGGSQDRGLAVGISSTQDVYWSGEYSGNVAFNSTTLVGLGSTDVFIAKLTGSNSLTWAGGLTGVGNESVKAIQTDANRGTIFAGTFQNSADVDPNPAQALISSTGNEDAYLVRWREPIPNDPPTLAALSNRTVAEGQLLTFTASATDPQTPTQTLAYRIVSGAPAGMIIDSATGIVTWTPTEIQAPGTWNVVIEVSDNAPNPLTDSKTVQITATEVNIAPSLAAILSLSIFEGLPWTYSVVGSDVDAPAQQLTYSLDSSPSGMTLDTSSGLLAWTPSEMQGPNSYSVVVRVTDNGSPLLSSTRSFTIQVKEANSMPSIAAISPLSATAGSAINFVVSGSDQDVPTQTLAFSLPPNTLGASIDPVTGEFRWQTPATGGGQRYDFVVTAQDNGTTPLAASLGFSITLLGQLELSWPGTSLSEANGGLVATVSRLNTDNLALPLTVNLQSSDNSEATVPGMVIIPAGMISTTFTINSQDDALLDGTQAVTISASASLFSSGSRVLQVLDQETLILAIDSPQVTELQSVVGRVTRGNADLSQPLTVTINNGNGTELSVPSQVIIPAGQATATFSLVGLDDGRLDGTATVIVSVAASGYQGSQAAIDVLDKPTLGLNLSLGQIPEGGGVASVQVTRSGDLSASLAVQLVISNSLAASVPTQVTIPVGQTTASFDVTSIDDNLVEGTQSVSVSATAIGFHANQVTLEILDDDVSWQNSPNPYDVNDDDIVDIQDILTLVYFFNFGVVGPIPSGSPTSYYDVTGDRIFDIRDILAEIYYFNTVIVQGEGEAAEAESLPTLPSQPQAELDDLIEFIATERARKKNRFGT